MRSFGQDEPSPIAKARGHARRLWNEFDRAVGRKHELLVTLRDERRLTPEDVHRIGSVVAEINDHLAALDQELEKAEAAVRKFRELAP